MIHEFEAIDTHSFTRMISVAIDCCWKIKSILDEESKAICQGKLIDILEDMLYTTSAMIMKLFKRNRLIPSINKTEGTLAIQMIRDLLKKIPEVVSESNNYRRPIQHIIVERHMVQTGCTVKRGFFRHRDICELLVNALNDLNVTDEDGNTLLHLVAKRSHYDAYSKPPCSVKSLTCLIDQGAYVHAKNKEGKTAIDYLKKFIAQHKDKADDEAINEAKRIFEMLDGKVPPLKCFAATETNASISKTDVPEMLQNFVKLH